MSKKTRVLSALLLVFAMVLSACTPNMKAYMAKNEEVSKWGAQTGKYNMNIDMTMLTEKPQNIKLPGTFVMENQDKENGKFEYEIDFSELKKIVAETDPEEAKKMPDKMKVDGYVKDGKAILNKDMFMQFGDDDVTSKIKDIKEKYISIDMGAGMIPGTTGNSEALKYMQSAEFTSDLMKLMDAVFKDYEPVVDYKVEGNTFTYEATIEELTAETLGLFKSVKKNWVPFVEQLKPIASKIVAEEEKAAIDEALKSFGELIVEVKDEDVKNGLDEVKEMLKGSKIKVVEEFKEDEVVQYMDYVINIDGLMKMAVTLDGSIKKADSVKIDFPTDVKELSFEEYMGLFVNVSMDEEVVLVSYDGEIVEFDTMPVIENGRTLVPFRALLEKLGATVEWDEENKVVTAIKGDTKIKLTIGSDKAYVNDKEITLDVPAKISEDRTLIPLRFVSENFGYTIDYFGDEKVNIINIYSEEFASKLEEKLVKP